MDATRRTVGTGVGTLTDGVGLATGDLVCTVVIRAGKVTVMGYHPCGVAPVPAVVTDFLAVGEFRHHLGRALMVVDRSRQR